MCQMAELGNTCITKQRLAINKSGQIRYPRTATIMQAQTKGFQTSVNHYGDTN